jgi:repressor of nif and glnA expression
MRIPSESEITINLFFDFLVLLLDELDAIILTYLGKNARISSEIRNKLQDIGYKITERAIRYRLQRLEKMT